MAVHPRYPQRSQRHHRSYAFNAVHKVGELVVFDIGDNKYRLIAYIRFEKRIVYIKAVLTHRDYDQGAWQS